MSWLREIHSAPQHLRLMPPPSLHPIVQRNRTSPRSRPTTTLSWAGRSSSRNCLSPAWFRPQQRPAQPLAATGRRHGAPLPSALWELAPPRGLQLATSRRRRAPCHRCVQVDSGRLRWPRASWATCCGLPAARPRPPQRRRLAGGEAVQLDEEEAQLVEEEEAALLLVRWRLQRARPRRALAAPRVGSRNCSGHLRQLQSSGSGRIVPSRCSSCLIGN